MIVSSRHSTGNDGLSWKSKSFEITVQDVFFVYLSGLCLYRDELKAFRMTILSTK